MKNQETGIKNKKGLTLIELLTVVTIMGILILISIPAISKVIENSRKKTFIIQVKTAVKSIKALHSNEEKTVYLFSELEEEIKSPFGGIIEGIVIFDEGKAYVFALDSNGKILDSVEERFHGDVVTPVDSNDIDISNIYDISERGGSGGFQHQIGHYISINNKKYFLSDNNEITEVNNIYLTGATVNLSIKEYVESTERSEIIEGLVLSRNGKKVSVLTMEYYPSEKGRAKAQTFTNQLTNPNYIKNVLLRRYDRNSISEENIRAFSYTDINSWASSQGYEGHIECNSSYIQNTYSVDDTKAIISQLGLNIEKEGVYYTTFFSGEDAMCYFPQNIEENNRIASDNNTLGQYRIVVTLDEDKCLINREDCVWPQIQ